MTELRGQLSGGPAWGGHLALDAIVAYVDEELSPGAWRRALEHLARCPECAAEVIAQTQARVALRGSAAPSLPSSLLSTLRAIPAETELPAPPAGLAVGPDGELVSVLREPRARRHPDRRVRLGAGVVASGLALGGLMVAGNAAGPGATPTASITPASSVGRSATLGGMAPASGIDAATGPSRSVLDARLQYGGASVVRTAPSPAPSSVPAAPAPALVRQAHG
jgi:anti-sigma factor RsiW